MKLQPAGLFSLKAPVRLEPAEPLWKVVPTHDEEGRPLNDFMMLLPGLRERSQAYIEQTFRNIQTVLNQYHEVVFANMNLQMNVLWISLRNRAGLTLELAGAIKLYVPEAVLVGHNPHY